MGNNHFITKQIIFFIFTIIIPVSLIAETIEVKKDGSGDFSIIQEAMNFAQENDTVLVWPGIYYENLNFNGKSLCLGSLTLTTDDESYKFTTIVDGNQSGSCLIIKEYVSNAIVNGFTLQNGRSEDGGGIYIFKSTATISNCIIKHNFSTDKGGGIWCAFDCNLYLSGNSIFNNYCYGDGGGVLFAINSHAIFDTINTNSIYSNYASRGCDFYKVTDFPLTIFLDTCTVQYPDTYFVLSVDDEGYPMNDLEIIVQNGIVNPYDGDIYVNPVLGSNENTGESWEEALKSIAFAYTKIAVDSTNKNTIYLANGIYSDTTNDEKFPLNIRPFINVIGQSRNGVILDGNRNIYLLNGNNNITDYSFQRMTLQGGPKPIYEPFEPKCLLARLYTGNDRLLLDSIMFRDSFAFGAYGILSYYQADSSVVSNCEFRNNIGGHAIRTANDTGIHYINNCVFSEQLPDFEDPDSPMGKAIGDGGSGSTVIQNCLFYDNPKYGVDRWFSGSTYLVNCTFVNNSELPSSAFLYVGDADMHLYNCISYNQGESPIAIYRVEPPKMITSHLNLYNSLIEGGEESIKYGDQCEGETWCKVHYDETNIDEDPVFLNMWEHPFMISDGSPCIDAGTLDLPDFIEIPEFDLAGNPRIVGGKIDMGAYEWNPTIVGRGENIYSHRPSKLTVYPNPSKGIVNIITTADNQTLKVFDITLQQKEEIIITDKELTINTSNWPSGLYLFCLYDCGELVATRKLVVK